MKSNQELLDFYGVELGKKYIITENKNNPDFYIGETFIVKELLEDKELWLELDNYDLSLSRLNDFDYKEVKEPLTNEEKEYLRVVIKPFRDRIKLIYKTETSNWFDGGEVLCFKLSGGYLWSLPELPKDEMFKGMEQDKCYTLVELGL